MSCIAIMLVIQSSVLLDQLIAVCELIWYKLSLFLRGYYVYNYFSSSRPYNIILSLLEFLEVI